jgi:predicted nucleotidyltransferase
MKRAEGIAVARTFRDALLERGYPVRRVVLFGSVARGQATEDSDLDIAVVCDRFAATRHEENMALRRLRWGIDIRIEPICLHPDDFGKRSAGIPGR